MIHGHRGDTHSFVDGLKQNLPKNAHGASVLSRPVIWVAPEQEASTACTARRRGARIFFEDKTNVSLSGVSDADFRNGILV